MSFSYQFNYLPSNILTLSGYAFFQFIKNTLGEPEANLLSKISVKTKSSFLLIENPLDIFNEDIEDEELDKLKEQLCFKMKNDKLLIKPGVLSGWCLENRENLGLESFELEENIDFSVNIYADHNLAIQGTIKCKCGKVIALSKNNEKIQVSNYYKHLLSVGYRNMKQIEKKAKEIELTKQQQQQQSIASVLSAPVSQWENSLMQVSDDEPMVAKRTSHESSAQPKNCAKRRIISQSQQHSSTKRIRT
ncbi:unnamed protein product [Rotaria sp. Silwood2]|nr:unnamed protein product [Rotaria sp. Silwood2]CAF3169080.1 unnamed protein product [Rotaria sp. Silwood2]CAF4423012.1 unnamed protein product [Rotaria sp. Silwood2]CAF4499729.1 unnamed protein product [Rotaria sp. Silwood2]CAF4518351.1 unnamed protein product [Rotaria sp. Silwood2]